MKSKTQHIVDNSSKITVVPVNFGGVEYFQVYIYVEEAETFTPYGEPHKTWQSAYNSAYEVIS